MKFLFLLAILLVSCESQKLVKENNIAQGARLFMSSCSACHFSEMDTLSENTPIARFLLAGKSRVEFQARVNDGYLEKGMPPWRGVYDEKQIDSIWAYVKSWK
ncbi:MAG: cytochrome c [Lentisphaeraceae bacterium]|nr:cytochrome c [Lentisphaeraceae bacterium]